MIETARVKKDDTTAQWFTTSACETISTFSRLVKIRPRSFICLNQAVSSLSGAELLYRST